MQSTAAKAHIEQQLPARLINALYDIARKYRPKGVRLFVFGSFVQGSDRRTSDLDLGIVWTEQRSSRVFSELYRDVQNLPTIRKIELVDMEQVDEEFKHSAMSDALFLDNEK